MLLSAWLFATEARSEVRPHALIGDGMVLQRGQPILLWGTAAAGENVTVQFREQSAATMAAADGRWSLEFAAQAAGGPYGLTIRGENVITIKDVYVGEVWVCGGQSNMGWPVATRPGSKELRGSENSRIRLFTVPPRLLDQPATDIAGTWQAAGPESLVGFSAVAYYFGVELEQVLNVPIGLIHASYGGSSVEQWIKAETLAEMKPSSATPVRPGGRVAVPTTSKLYNGMLSPLIPYAIRGVIWYQGEADVGRARQYEAQFTALIESWRRDWKQGPFPFLFVQIAPYGKIVDQPTASNSAVLREAQRNVSRKVERTGMAVVTDWGHETDIHVKQKKPVGYRLALLARVLTYGERERECSGPEFTAAKFIGEQAVLSFDHIAEGLVAKKMVLENFSTDPRTGNGGALHVVDAEVGADSVPLKGFTIAGKDKRFVAATAEIRGNQVVVTSPDVAEPVAVRYGWADYPTGNLSNSAGLPASPFRTDDWSLDPLPVPVRGENRATNR
jgi:sialate O-acetylesterase